MTEPAHAVEEPRRGPWRTWHRLHAGPEAEPSLRRRTIEPPTTGIQQRVAIEPPQVPMMVPGEIVVTEAAHRPEGHRRAVCAPDDLDGDHVPAAAPPMPLDHERP